MDIEKINVGGTQYDVCDTVARAALSDEFSTGGTYAVGDYCIYENTLYKFTAAKEPGAWDASKVAATQIGDELSQLNGKITLRASKFLTTGAYQTAGTVKYIDTGIGFKSGDICVVYSANGSETSNIIYVPCVKEDHWYISCNTPAVGGGPDGFQVLVINIQS